MGKQLSLSEGRFPLVLTLMLGFVAAIGRAESNSNYIFNATSTNFGGSFTVGNGANATNNLLEISNGGTVTNTTGTLGTGGGHWNNAFVTNDGSMWVNLGTLTIGEAAAASRSNSLTIADSGFVFSTNVWIGNVGSYNSALVTGAGSVWSNVLSFTVGGAGTAPEFNSLTISDGGILVSGSGTIGSGSGANNNQAIISGVGSIWTNTGNFNVGLQGKTNQLILEAGGQLHNAIGTIGSAVVATNNSVLVTGTNSLWNNTDRLYVGENGPGSQLVISNGGRVVSSRAATQASGVVGNSASSTSNLVVITGTDSMWSNTAFLIVGNAGSGTMIVADGGQVVSAGTLPNVIGNQSSSSGNRVEVTDDGSLWTVATNLQVGNGGVANTLIVSNAGQVTVAGTIRVGVASTSSNNLIVVTGAGSMLKSDGFVAVGSNSTTAGSGSHIRVTDGGTLEASGLTSGFDGSGSISNIGGVYQFTTANPGITNNTAGSIAITGGTISFRGIANANVDGNITGTRLTNVAFAGDNTFQLNHATNTSVTSYTFDSVANTGDARNYQRLALRDNARWQSDNLAIGTGGALIGSGTVASANVTNHGVIAPGFAAGALTFTSNLVLGATSELQMEIGGSTPSLYDQLIVSGGVTLTGALMVSVIDGFVPTPGQTFTLIDNLGAGLLDGQFTGLANDAFIDASANGVDAFFRIQYNAGDGNDLLLLAVVPEPSASVLMAGLLLLLRRKARRG